MKNRDAPGFIVMRLLVCLLSWAATAGCGPKPALEVIFSSRETETYNWVIAYGCRAEKLCFVAFEANPKPESVESSISISSTPVKRGEEMVPYVRGDEGELSRLLCGEDEARVFERIGKGKLQELEPIRATTSQLRRFLECQRDSFAANAFRTFLDQARWALERE